jgi:hypothetical protein
MLNQVDDCWSIDCNGTCLPDLTERPNFANEKMAAKKSPSDAHPFQLRDFRLISAPISMSLVMGK